MKKTSEKKFAFVLGRITPAKERDSIQRLWELGCVDDVQFTAGNFDFVVKIHFDSFESFFESYMQIKHIADIKPEKILIAANGD